MSKLGSIAKIVGGIVVGMGLNLLAFLGGCIFTVSLMSKVDAMEKEEEQNNDEGDDE